MSSAISFDSNETPRLPIHRFTVEQYHQLGTLGLLTPEDRVELLEGWIVEKMNQNPGHGFVVRLLDQWLQSKLPTGWLSQCQLPITTARSEPEPDLAVVCGVHTDFRDRHPSGDDCRLLIEVADTSLSKDRAKVSIYAAARIDEYWIVNLVDKQLEQFLQPDGSEYQQTAIFSSDDAIETQIGEATLRLALSEILR